MPTLTIHTNPSMRHQVQWAKSLKAGAEALGWQGQIEYAAGGGSGVHVVQGPHFAMRSWLGQKNVIMLDRCWWGDPWKYCTLGWLRADRGRDLPGRGTGRWAALKADCEHLRLPEPTLSTKRPLIVGDWPENPEIMSVMRRLPGNTLYRPHPDVDQNKKNREPLAQAFANASFVVGWRTTALVSAALARVPVICLDERNPVWPVASLDLSEHVDPYVPPEALWRAWVELLSWSQWSHDELRDGSALSALLPDELLSEDGSGETETSGQA